MLPGDVTIVNDQMEELVEKLAKQFSFEDEVPKLTTQITISEASNGFIVDIEETAQRRGATRRFRAVEFTIEDVAKRMVTYFNGRKEHEKANLSPAKPGTDDPSGVGHFI